MKIVMITNLITPHQIPLCNALFERLQDDFVLIETMKRNSELPSGWRASPDALPYVITETDHRQKKVDDLIMQADCVIIGAAPMHYVKNRLKKNLLTFRYAERVYKEELHWYEIPLRSLKYYFEFSRYKELFLLCASGFTYPDYLRTGTFRGKAFKWGYFPFVKKYDIDTLLQTKNSKDYIEIMWSGRMLDWKHPECAVLTATYLRSRDIDFHMRIIGSGVMKDHIRKMVDESKLDDCIEMISEVTPEQNRRFMEEADIFLFTSDRNEGWGATLNEAMNSGCTVVASHLIGAVPFLLNGENGLIYEDGNTQELFEKTEWLIKHSDERAMIARRAYETIAGDWNAECAADRLIALSRCLLNKGSSRLFSRGICSAAEKISDTWYKGKHNEKED